MAILTCGEMIAECLERRESGWRQFIREYLPFTSAVLDRHFPALISRRDELLRVFLERAAESDGALLRGYSGQSEREFLLYLRDQAILLGEERQPPSVEPEIALEFGVFEKALAALSTLERQILWTALLARRHDDTAGILRLESTLVANCIDKAQEALRASSDRWSAETLFDNRRPLLAGARGRRTDDCPTPRVFLRLIDGQITWRDRTDLEHHLNACWHCVDRICGFREVVFLRAKTGPLPDADVKTFLKLLAIDAPAPRSRLFAFIRGHLVG